MSEPIDFTQLAKARQRWSQWDDDDLTVGSEHPFWPMVVVVDAVLEANQQWMCWIPHSQQFHPRQPAEHEAQHGNVCGVYALVPVEKTT